MNIMVVIGAINYNKGSEALVRGLLLILKKKYPNSHITLALYGKPIESIKKLAEIDAFVNRNTVKYKYSIRRIVRKIFWELGAKKLSVQIGAHQFVQQSKRQDLIINFAADNYDKSYGGGERNHIENLLLKEHSKARLCLYDFSLEKSHIDKNVEADVQLADIVTVRESLTHQNFTEAFPQKTIYFYPDPAFIMPPEETMLPRGWEQGCMVGINISNLILRDAYLAGKDKVLGAYNSLIDYIIDNTVLKIAFVPHVMNNADLSALSMLYEKYKKTGRVLLIDDQELTAPQLKYIISKCRFYVGARTHSTIAAYSSLVPTLVFGYSIKSLGIATDLFGGVENYVVSSQSLSNSEELANRFKWLMANETMVKKNLEDCMPDYMNTVWGTADVL